MARRSAPSSRRRDLVHPKLPPTITLAVAAEVDGDTVVLTAVEPMTYNVRMSNPESALPGLIYQDVAGTHAPQLVTLTADNTIATVDFGLPLLAPGTLSVGITMRALRSFRGGQIVIGTHAFTPPPPSGYVIFDDGYTNGPIQGQGTANHGVWVDSGSGLAVETRDGHKVATTPDAADSYASTFNNDFTPTYAGFGTLTGFLHIPTTGGGDKTYTIFVNTNLANVAGFVITIGNIADPVDIEYGGPGGGDSTAATLPLDVDFPFTIVLDPVNVSITLGTLALTPQTIQPGVALFAGLVLAADSNGTPASAVRSRELVWNAPTL